MSHLTPHRSVTITPGGSPVPGSNVAYDRSPVEPDTSWEATVASLAATLALDDGIADQFATKVDQTAESLALVAGIDLEVARTKVRGALLGQHAMVTDTIPIHLDDAAVDALLAEWDVEPNDQDRVLARLSILHHDLVAPVPDPTSDDTVGEGSAGSGEPLPETAPEVFVGQVGYTLDSVPATARDVVAWISDGEDLDDQRARAQAAQEVEAERDGDPRATVAAAIDSVLRG